MTSNSKKWLWIGMGAAALAATVTASLLYLFRNKRKCCKPKVFFVAGSPCGKGRMCEALAKKYSQVAHLPVSEIVQKELERKDSLHAEDIQKAIKEGTLLNAHIVVDLLQTEMEAACIAGKTVLLIDGFPRNEECLARWKEIFGKDICVYKFILFDEGTSTKPLLLRSRSINENDSDTFKKVKERFDTRKEEIRPIVEYFTKENGIVRIDASDPDAVEIMQSKLEKIIEPAL
eukprot:TRINITY_DN375_c0_g1_i1.p1 TRINITY_DN375_c0_g1~~TRINITY_DN375_c0_g1_i1.p1  ORF type:complete len:256 (-),score=51.91 TRINITY_DN375_c0_g1_i1:357-1052(-)